MAHAVIGKQQYKGSLMVTAKCTKTEVCLAEGARRRQAKRIYTCKGRRSADMLTAVHVHTPAHNGSCWDNCSPWLYVYVRAPATSLPCCCRPPTPPSAASWQTPQPQQHESASCCWTGWQQQSGSGRASCMTPINRWEAAPQSAQCSSAACPCCSVLDIGQHRLGEHSAGEIWGHLLRGGSEHGA